MEHPRGDTVRDSTIIDPLTAFGLAANIIESLDLGGRIVQTGYSTYNSARGAQKENIQLEQVTTDLIHVTEGLTVRLTSDDGALSIADANLETLGRQCQDLAKRLFEILNKLKITSDKPFRGWQALQIAVKTTVTKKSESKSLTASLNTYRQQITTHLLLIMRYV